MNRGSLNEDPLDPELRILYPGKTDEWLREAQENLTKYIELTEGIYKRIRNDSVEYAQFKKELSALKNKEISKKGKVA